MSVVVDASVLIKWFVFEELRPEARRLATIVPRLIAPDFLLTEMTNILWKKIQRGEFDPKDAALIMPGLRRSGIRFLPNELLLQDALDIACSLEHPVYDCLYIAAMHRSRERFITWDKPLYRKLERSPWAASVYLLSDVDRLLAHVAA